MHAILKEYLIFAALLLFSGASWQWSASYSGRKVLLAQPASARSPMANRPAGTALPGAVLPGPYRVLSAPRPGHVEEVYVSEGQAVHTGDLLLKLAVGHGSKVEIIFVSAPAAGKVVALEAALGAYLPAGTAYARLRGSPPVRVLAAAQLTVGGPSRQ